ncbi:MAG: hypothetical protein WB615_03725 [Candidatus Tumulicola sp.]
MIGASAASRPFAIAAMLLGIGLATLAAGLYARARVLARGSLGNERLASNGDRAQSPFPTRLRQTGIAVAAAPL